MKKIVILISGRGSNMQAVVKACRDQAWNAKIVAVFSNKRDAAGLAFAQANGVKTEVVAHQQFSDRESFDQALQAKIMDYQPDWVILAGFMRILTASFVQAFEGRLINLHPALLPSFKGVNTCARALDARVAIHGSTVHFVTNELDSGPIIAQIAVPVLLNDEVSTLEKRILKAEHQLLPGVVRWLIEGQIRWSKQGLVFAPNVQRWRFMNIETQ